MWLHRQKLNIFLTALLIVPAVIAQGFSTETCTAERHHAQVEADADVVIGAILDMHRPGQGVFGCGQPSVEGVQIFEALRWSIAKLNEDKGISPQKQYPDTFIPGVKFGLDVYDSCGHKGLAIRYMTELFPVMKSGPQSCGSFEQNSSMVLGIVDTSGSANNQRVLEAVNNYVIPIIPLNEGTAIPPEQLAKVLAEVVHDMDWERIAILHADDEYSIAVTKVFGQIAVSGYPCISVIRSIPTYSRKGESIDIRQVHKTMTSALSKLSEGTGIVVIGHGKSLEMVLESFQEATDHFSKFQWLFSWILPSINLSKLAGLFNTRRVFSLSPYPVQVSDFEIHWSRLQDIASWENPEDGWFLEYVMFQKGCRVLGYHGAAYGNLILCENLFVKESPTDTLLRTARFLPAFHSVITFAQAFRKAWAEKCLEVPGICSELRRMTRRDFAVNYLEPLEFEHGPTLRSPVEVRGQKTAMSGRGEVEGVQLALNVYSYTQGQGLNYKQVLAYDSQEAKVLDEDFHYQPSTCPKGGCKNCVSVRQSRLEDSDQSASSSEDFITMAKSEDVLIPILLPVHHGGQNPMDCGEYVNHDAIQALEAALWAVDRINADPDFLPGVNLGVVAIDTCSSPLKLTQKVSNFLMESSKRDADDLSSALAFIVSGTSEEFTSLFSITSKLNITTLASSDAVRAKDMSAFKLQTAVPLETKTAAVAEALKYMGWSYVSVIYDEREMNFVKAQSFRISAQESNICLAAELKIDSLEDVDVDYLVMKLVAAKERGARVIVLWTEEASTKAFLRALWRATVAGVVAKGDFVLICNGKRIEDFAGFENEAAGALVFKAQYGDLQDFAASFQRLRPENNKRNPWFKELWDQLTNPENSSALRYKSNSMTMDTVHAVLAVTAGLARMRNEVCLSEKGLCPRLLHEPNLRALLFKYIRETASSRLDRKGELFKFNKRGYGNIPVDIFNIRKGSGNNIMYHKVGTYQDGLTNMMSMAAYNESGEEIGLDEILSDCMKPPCSECTKRTMDFIVLDSPDKIYLAITVGVHQSTENPLLCGPISTTSGLQNLEAFLWALDQVNVSPQLLPGVTVGAVVFDTCGSRERVARDVSNLMGNSIASLSPTHKLPGKKELFAFIATQSEDIADAVVDVTIPLKVMSIASDVVSTKYNDLSKYSHLLRASLPNDILADNLISLIKHFQWTYISIVVSEKDRKEHDLLEALRSDVERHNIQLATVQKMSSNYPEPAMNNVLNQLKLKQESGARVVLLLLNFDEMSALFSTIQKWQNIGKIHPGDFIWIAYDNVEVFHLHPEVSQGSMMIRQSSGSVMPFRQYFEHLSLKNNTRNPWFREYWEQIFKCKGAACYSETHKNLAHVPFMQDPSVPRIINSVLSISVGLEALRQTVCQGFDRGMCSAMREDPQTSGLLFNLTRMASFMGADGKPFHFTEGNFADGSLEVFNFRQVGNNAHAFISVGKYDLKNGLNINSSRVKGYDEDGQELSMYEISSRCNDSKACTNDPDVKQVSMMQLVPQQEFAIAVLMPLHERGETFFTCGHLKDQHMFQNLAAVLYSVNKVNSNRSLIPGVEIGALVLDYCGRKQKAQEQLYSFLSQDVSGKTQRITPRSVVATLTFDEDVAGELSPVLEAASITQIATPSETTSTKQDPQIIHTVPSAMTQVQVLLSILKHFKWQYVNFVYSNTDFGRSGYYHFSKGAKNSGICLSEIIEVDPGYSETHIASLFQINLGRSRAKIVVTFVEGSVLMRNVIEAAQLADVLDRFTWIGSESWGSDIQIANAVRDKVIDALTVQMESHDMPEFKKYFSSLSLRNHGLIPDLWFEEFWQHHFQCQLPHSTVPQNQYPTVCSGRESLESEQISQDKHVYHTVRAVESIAAGLHKYLTEQCVHGEAAMSIDDCGENARKDLRRQIQIALMGISQEDCAECGAMGSIFGYEVLHLKDAGDGTYSYSQIGKWKDGTMSLNESDLQFSTGTIPESVCVVDCSKCSKQLGLPENLFAIEEPIYQNFKSVWGITVTSLSVLGITLVVICALYFLMSFPVTVGTTVLGYMILFGLLTLYAVNFAFVIAPTEGTCGVRRFGLGLAYAIIFSGMLVKVMNTWRLMGYNGSRILNDGTRLSSPAGLLVIAVGLVIIQIVLSAAWLILMPPKIGAYESVWRCDPPTTFEEGLVVSLVYVMLLLAITTLFAILTWHCQDNNRESRWILACACMVGIVWLAWTVLSTQLSPHYRDMTIAVANLVCATIIMGCLYIRKVYLYSKLTRQARDQELKTHLQPSAYPHSLYGTAQKTGPFSNLAPVFYGSQASLNGKKLYNGPSSRLELINCPEDNKSDSSGSVQVQAADLYPLDMYDGGSQFQPVNSLYGSNHTLVLDDTLTFAR